MIRMYSPLALRIPLLTAAPFPLLYGCRMTQAPASRALAAVSSAEPSSTTMISCHRAALRSSDTTVAMLAASFIAGMTMETAEGSAKELLDDAVPRDRTGDGLSRVPEALGERSIGREPVDGGGQRHRVGRADESVDAVAHEFERTSRICGGDHGPRGEKRFERHVSVVLIERHVDDAARTGVEIRDRVAPQRASEFDAIRGGRLRRFPFEGGTCRSFADDHKPRGRGHPR